MADDSPPLSPVDVRTNPPLGLPAELAGLGVGSPLTRREFWLALVLALVVFAWPVRESLFDPGRVLLGVDTATTQLPWRAAIEARADPDTEEPVRPRNAALYDQGVVFYPFYRWVARSWLAGDPPLWNPDIYVGAPGVGNPQSGVLDPQVGLLVLLEAIGGRGLFDWGFALVAWLRLAAAGLGAYLLARRLGCKRAGASLAGLGFGLSGYLVLWLGHPLGHVPPLLPWVLFFLEGLRGEHPRRSAAGAGIALWLAILGGHPETAFYVGLAGGLWALALVFEDRRAGLLGLGALALGTLAAGAALLPFVEYLGLSAAQAVREGEAARTGVDLVALGSLVLALALVAAWRLRGEAPDPASMEAVEPGQRGPAPRIGLWLGGLGLALAVGGVALVLRGHGLVSTAALALVPDWLGKPGHGSGGYFGPRAYLEEASAWMPIAILVLAGAAWLSPGGPLRRRGLIAGLGLVAWLLCLRVPGLLDLYRHIPVVGLGATERFGVVSSLMLALLAGEALDAAARLPRAVAVGIALALVVALTWERELPALPESARPAVEQNETLGFTALPEPVISRGGVRLSGWIYPGIEIDRAVVRYRRIDAEGKAVPGAGGEVPALLSNQAPGDSRPERLANAPAGASFFQVSYLDALHLEEGHWALSVLLYRAGLEQPLDERSAGAFAVERRGELRAGTLVLGGLGLVVLLLAAPGSALSWVLVLLVLLQALAFANGLNPAVPRAECFPLTRTEERIRAAQGDGRFFSEPMVLPPDTGLVHGLRALDGYDGLDPLIYNVYRDYAMKPSLHSLLGWHARGVELDSAAFRLLGVNVLALRSPIEAQGWEPFAGPGVVGAEAECWLYRATDPLPRAFVVPGVISVEELNQILGAAPELWDPLQVAALQGPWRPEVPATRHAVEDLRFEGNGRVTLRAALDGEGLLVLTDLYFPGWVCEVDGEETEILPADGIFRGVPLGPGEHQVSFTYRPDSFRYGWMFSALGLLALALLAAVPRRSTARAEA